MRQNRGIYCRILLLLGLFISYSSFTHAQCDYKIKVEQQKISDCWSNGVIKATLYGPNTINGNVQTHDAQYSLESVPPGGYSMAFDKNGGIIQNVPPGVYKVTAQAFCNGNWVSVVSDTVSVKGTYIDVNTNMINVVTGGANAIKPSKECIGTGEVSIKMDGGGKKPFKITIVTSPSGYMDGVVFDSLTSDVFTMDSLMHGNYTFRWTDDCGKSFFNLAATVSKTLFVATATIKKHARSCLSEGSIEVKAEKGLEPYKIIIVTAPAAYSGPDTITALVNDGIHNLDNLPHGTYQIKIEDDCGATKTYWRNVNEITLKIDQKEQTNSIACDSTGTISFRLKDGVHPYSINLSIVPGTYLGPRSFVTNSDSVFKISKLPAGTYKIGIVDACLKGGTLDFIIESDAIKITGQSFQNSASCITNGSITINGITGGKAPYDIEIISPALGHVGTINGGDITLPNLAHGDYVIRITDNCTSPHKDTLIILQTVDTLKLAPPSIISTGLSLACIFTGNIKIHIDGGVPPYLVILDTVKLIPSGTWPPSLGALPDTTKLPAPGQITLDSLPGGEYRIIVVDSCGARDTLNLAHTKVTGLSPQTSVPADPFERFFYSPATLDVNCKALRVKKKSVSGGLGDFWNGANSATHYEVKFVYKGDSTSWLPVTHEYVRCDSLPTFYKEMRDSNGFVEAIVRIKGDIDTCAFYMHDTIRLDTLKSNVAATAQACNGFDLKYSQQSIDSTQGILCYPYEWYLLHGTDTIRKSSGKIPDESEQTESNILPYGSYVMHFKDREGTKWQETFTVNWSNPSTAANISYFDFLCGTYSINFAPAICFPYNWRVIDSVANTIHALGNGVTDNAPPLPTVTGLVYGKAYRLQLIDNLGDTTYIPVKYERTSLFDFKIDSDALYCFPDIGKGSISISRNGGLALPVGTRIRYVSGPSVPKHADTVIIAAHGVVTEFFPFTADSIFTNNAYDSILIEGHYEFEITDTCGVSTILPWDYYVYHAGPFTYTENVKCTGSQVFPTATIWKNSIQHTVYFRIKSSPTGVSPDPSVVTNGGFLLLQESGTYTIQSSLSNSSASCPIDTISIDFYKKTVRLDADATIAYICDTVTAGYIFVRAIEGEGPYTFELWDRGVRERTKNPAGGDCEFQYGKLGETYQVVVIDETCKVSFPQNVTMLDISEQRFIFGTENVCFGDPIHLNSISISDKYKWEKIVSIPAAPFTDSILVDTLQNIIIPNAGFADSGTYVIHIKPYGCLQPINQTIDVKVHRPAEPLGDTINIICLNTTPPAFNVSALPGHTLQWYGTDSTTQLGAPPVPPTHAVDTITYYITQINDTMGCESPKQPIVAIISDLPVPAVNPHSLPICAFDMPEIILPVTDSGYVYVVYNAPVGGDTINIGVGTGDTVRIQGTVALPNSTIYYIEIFNVNKCPGLARTPVDIPVVQPPAMPNLTPVNIVCLNTVADTLTATGLPLHTLQWYDTDTVTMLPQAPVPPTHAVDTITYFVSQITDSMGCESAKKPITVIISDLPGLVPNVDAPPICPDAIPTVILQTTQLNYTYNLYDSITGGRLMSTVMGNPSGNVTLNGDTPLTASTIYYIETLNEYLCEGFVRTPVNITVVASPPKPSADTLNILCLNSATPALTAVADPGHYLQWYGTDGVTKLAAAPVPPTHTVGTITYYVSQLSNSMDCESDLLPVVAIIRDLPSPAVNPHSLPICENEIPEIILPVTDSAYTYILYTAAVGGDSINTGIGTGDTVKIQSTIVLTASTTYYIEIINEVGCYNLNRTPVFVEVVPLPAKPVVKPANIVCLNTTAAPMEATILIGHTIQWYDTDGVTPLPTAPVPPTHAVDTITYYVTQSSDTMGCESLLQPVVVIISDLPGLVPNVNAPPICPDAIPTVILQTTQLNYTYNLYTHATGGTLMSSCLGTGTSGDLYLYGDTPLTANTIYYIETLNEHLCEGFARTPVNITVVASPPKPTADIAYIVCLFSVAPPLTAIAAANHHLQWYDVDGVTPLAQAPVPSTAKVDTITYYVTQLSNSMNCESPKLPVVAIISDLPGEVPNSSPIICPGMSPVVNIPNSILNYTYSVYTKAKGGSLVGGLVMGTGGALSIPTTDPVINSTTYYIEVLNELLCAALDRTPINVVVENYLYIKPDTIPAYDRAVPYNVQLTTNAASPYIFSSIDALPLGFKLSILGQITGTAPSNGKIEPEPFTIQVIDSDGCVAIKTYQLESDLFVPQVFTPNGDGANDHFMKGERLIIFDRLGIKIFEGTDGWDGTRKGQPAPGDTYFYVVFYADEYGVETHKTGYITLLRRQ